MFEALSPDSWIPEIPGDHPALNLFSLYRGSNYVDLKDFSIEFAFPLSVRCAGEDVYADLLVVVDVGNGPTTQSPHFNAPPAVRLDLSLTLNGITYQASAIDSVFEDVMISLQKSLPSNVHLRCCFGCAFSDYSVYGNQFFGSMMCFRNLKPEYLRVQNKSQYLGVMDDERVVTVRETHYCPEFEVRVPGTGYRG